MDTIIMFNKLCFDWSKFNWFSFSIFSL